MDANKSDKWYFINEVSLSNILKMAAVTVLCSATIFLYTENAMLKLELEDARSRLDECERSKRKLEDEKLVNKLFRKIHLNNIEELRDSISRTKKYIESLEIETGRIRNVGVTAYILNKNLTASGEPVRVGTVAVSRDLHSQGWTFGRNVYIDGYGVHRITDLMGAQWRNKLDIWVPTYDTAKQIGSTKTVARLMPINEGM